MPRAEGGSRWPQLRRRLIDLAQWVWDEFGLSVTRHTLSRELRAMGGAAQGSGDAKHRWKGCGGYRKLSARPRHRGQKPEDIELFKKASPTTWRRSAGSCRAARR